MATKAQLEAELADLRRQLAERDAADTETAEPPDEPTAPPSEEAGEWDAIVHEVVKEFEALPLKRPLLAAAGIFAFGWLLGRSSR